MEKNEDINIAEEITERYDDYALDRVPEKDKIHWFTIAIMRFGQISALSQFIVGATLGFGMDFWPAFWAITLGAAILEIAAIFVGIAGQKEGISTSLLVRWTGFGKFGSLLISIIIAVSMIGWFGIQNEVFAVGLQEILGGPVWAWSIVTGLAVTIIVIFGVLSLGIIAYITVPLFLIVVLYSITSALSDFSLGDLISMSGPGDSISIATGATIVAGGFMAGAIITPDISRYNRSSADVVKQSLWGILPGEYLIGLTGVILAHAMQSSDVISIVMGTSGTLGVIALITATLKINDFNLYAPSLAVVNFIDSVFNKRVNRVVVTIILGILGTSLSVMGILSQFEGFLSILGIALPPVGGIIIAEYYFIRRYRKELKESGEKGRLPETFEAWNPISLISWGIAFLVGLLIDWGIPSFNSMLVATLLYTVISLIINRNGNVMFGSINTYGKLKK